MTEIQHRHMEEIPASELDSRPLRTWAQKSSIVDLPEIF